MNRTKILVIGLDGATFDIIKPMVSSNRLPAFKSLMKDGAWGELSSTILPVTPQAWASLMTGRNPGKHGLYGFYTFVNGSYETRLTTGTSIRAKRLWEYFDGERVGLIDIPMSFPPQKVNGYMISGWPVPSEESIFTYPPELHSEIILKLGEYVIDKTFLERNLQMRQKGESIKAISSLAKYSQQRKDAAMYLLENKGPFDFFMVVFRAPDFAQHVLFKVFDGEYAERNPKFCIKYNDVIFQVYEMIDQYVADLMDIAGKESTVIIVSDHGAGPVRKRFYLNRWLKKEGFLHTRNRGLPWSVKLNRKPLSDFLDRVGFPFFNSLLPSSIRQLNIPYPKRYLKHPSLSVHWEKTSAFGLLTWTDGVIRINLVGREPEGSVSQAEYEQVRTEIIKRLKEFTDPHTGESIIENIYRREEVYSGRFAHEAPDLLVVPRGYSYEFSPAVDDGVLLERPEEPAGIHRMNGIFLATGPYIKAGMTLNDINITDVAPTILYLMDKPIPESMDGRVIEEAIVEEYFRKNTPRYHREKEDGVPKHIDKESLDHDRKIEETLRALGYID